MAAVETKAGLCEARFLECRLRETEVQDRIQSSEDKNEDWVAKLSFDLSRFAFSGKSARGRKGEF